MLHLHITVQQNGHLHICLFARLHIHNFPLHPLLRHYHPLGFFSTPLHPLPRLQAHLGNRHRLYIKRDDMTGLASGGNKTRKLEYLLHEALQQGADTLITAGAQQSNHCRQTAAAAAQAGLACHLLLGGEEPERYTGNLLLMRLLGAQLHFCGPNRKGEDLPQLQQQLVQQGRKPHLVPYGGSDETGALGYVRAMFELQQQLQEQQIEIDHIYFASSSGGTHAGLLLGRELTGLQAQVHGISIDKEDVQGQHLQQQIALLANQAGSRLGISRRFELEEVRLLEEYHTAGYGVVTAAEREALQLLARTEGILLDPVYTGRAFSGMLQELEKRPELQNQSVLFWHTGGLPALFAGAEL